MPSIVSVINSLLARKVVVSPEMRMSEGDIEFMRELGEDREPAPAEEAQLGSLIREKLGE